MQLYNQIVILRMRKKIADGIKMANMTILKALKNILDSFNVVDVSGFGIRNYLVESRIFFLLLFRFSQ